MPPKAFSKMCSLLKQELFAHCKMLLLNSVYRNTEICSKYLGTQFSIAQMFAFS